MVPKFVMDNSESKFWDLVSQSKTLMAILERSPELEVPNWYFGAGCLAQTIWNLLTGKHPDQFINDIDWVYFDAGDLSPEGERKAEERVRQKFADIRIKFDVKNQARVHSWYKQKFGYEILPYQSIQDAIRTWPTTATAVVVTKVKGQPTVFAPYGLADLLSMTARPNKRQITKQIYLSKVSRWKTCWPSLKVIDWVEADSIDGRHSIC